MRARFYHLRLLASSTIVIASISATPAHAQLLTLGDVINALVQLDATVTLQGQTIATVQTNTNQNGVAIGILQGTTGALATQVGAVVTSDGLQNGAIAQLGTDVAATVGVNVLQDGAIAQLGADVAAVVGTNALQDGAIAQLGTNVAAVIGTNALQDGAIAQLGTDLAGVVGTNLLQDGAISQLGSDLAGVIGTNLLQDGAIGQLGADVVALAGTNALQDVAIAGLDGRLGVNEALDAIQDGAIAGLDVRLSANDALDALQDGAIAGLGTRLSANEVLDGVQATAIVDLGTRLVANTLRDDAQDVLLAYHDVVLGDHDVRITLAQGTADNALASVAVLRSDIDAGRAGLVRIDGGGNLTVGAAVGGTSVSFAGTAGNRRLTGLADGTAPSDAATVGQVTRGDAATLASANAYTDASLSGLTTDIDRMFATLAARDSDLRSELDAAAAGSAALAGMPQAFVPGKGMVAMAVGGRGSEMAVAVGVGKAFTGTYMPVVRAGAAIDSKRGQVTYNAGVGLHF